MGIFSRLLSRQTRPVPPKIRARYGGISGMTFVGGAFAKNLPDRTFLIGLATPEGEVLFASNADRSSTTEDIPDGHGFVLPIPHQWITEDAGPRFFQFRVIETGATFPGKPIEFPREQLREELIRDLSATDHSASCPFHAATPAPDIETAIDRGVNFLTNAQREDGEFTTLLSDDPQLRDGQWDSSPFVTSLICHSLSFCPETARPSLEKGLDFLESQMEDRGVWRYYSRKQFKHARIPPDLDDTCCASFVLKKNGRTIPDNIGTILANRDSEGRFGTWLVPGETTPPEFCEYLARLEKEAEDRTPPTPVEFQKPGRFELPKDPAPVDEIDPVVNANVVLYLGHREETASAIDYLNGLFETGGEPARGHYYAEPVSLCYMIARAETSGAAGFEPSSKMRTAYVESLLQSADTSVLRDAMGVCSLLRTSPESPAIGLAIERIRQSQNEDGSWDRETFYRGLHECWGSDELTTAFCLEALARYEVLDREPADEPRGDFDIDFEDSSFVADPYPIFQTLRKDAPIFFSPSERCWVFSRYRDCEQILKDPDTFTTREYSFESSLIGADGPSHERVRAATRELFHVKWNKDLKVHIRRWAEPLVKKLATGDSVEFMDAVARPLPVRVVSHLMRIDPGREPDLERWAKGFVFSGTDVPMEEAEKRAAECNDFFRRHIANQSQLRRDDGFQFLLDARENGALTEHELLEVCQLLMVAGFITTVYLIGNSVYYLAAHPELQAQLKKAPKFISSYIEELLRFETPPQDVRRKVTRDTAFEGHTLRKGEWVRLLLGSANRDETVFSVPDKFQIDRKPNPHLSFGSGPHVCLGMHLARIETSVVIDLLLDRFQTIKPAWPEGDHPLLNRKFLRGTETLPLRFH